MHWGADIFTACPPTIGLRPCAAGTLSKFPSSLPAPERVSD